MNAKDRRKSLEELRIEYQHLRHEMDGMNGDEYRFQYVSGRITEIEQELDRRKSA